jgi:hypothetical protein
VARIVEAIGRHRSGALSCVEAAEALGMSERHFRRLRERYEAEGAEGLIDRRRGRASGRPAPVDRIEWVHNPLDVVELALEKGAATVLMPVSCRRPLVDLSDDVATKVQVLSYLDAADALRKSIHEG